MRMKGESLLFRDPRLRESRRPGRAGAWVSFPNGSRTLSLPRPEATRSGRHPAFWFYPNPPPRRLSRPELYVGKANVQGPRRLARGPATR